MLCRVRKVTFIVLQQRQRRRSRSITSLTWALGLLQAASANKRTRARDASVGAACARWGCRSTTPNRYASSSAFCVWPLARCRGDLYVLPHNPYFYFTLLRHRVQGPPSPKSYLSPSPGRRCLSDTRAPSARHPPSFAEPHRRCSCCCSHLRATELQLVAPVQGSLFKTAANCSRRQQPGEGGHRAREEAPRASQGLRTGPNGAVQAALA